MTQPTYYVSHRFPNEPQYTWETAPPDAKVCDMLPTEHQFLRYNDKFKVYGVCRFCGVHNADIRTIECPKKMEYWAEKRKETTARHVGRMLAGAKREREEEEITTQIMPKPQNDADAKKEKQPETQTQA